ncbi:hypothetical protein AO265_01750 [Pseudomonas sp. ABAC61]|nr:hypothetical protein AO265_01750 [Pseudomonas sp. ABAC61]
MNKLKALNAAATRYLSRFSRKQFFCAFAVTTALNFWLSFNVPGYTSIYLSMLSGWFFGMMFINRESGQ